MVHLLYFEESRKRLGELIRPHRHDFWQLDVTLIGQFSTIVDGQSYSNDTGNLLFIPPNASHELVCKSNRGHALIFKFSDARSERRVRLLPSTPRREGLVTILASMMHEWQLREEPPLRCQIDMLLETLWIDAYQRQESPSPPSRRSLVARIDALLEARPGSHVTVADAARAVGYSGSHTSRLFRQERGESLKHYLDRRRAEAARTLLRFSELTISEIAHRLEFADLSSFSRFIRQQLGCSPREIRAG